MAELMNRARGLAEGVVVMICPVLLALALNKVDLNGEVYGHGVPIAMIAMAGVTLITGICPLLACCFSKRFPGANLRSAPVTASLATFSSSCLLVLACLIAQLVVSKSIAITIGVVFGLCVLVRTVCYYHEKNAGQYTERMQDILDESHEFLTGVTGILFLGFEGLALEGHNQILQKGGSVGTISFIVCAVGVCLMFLEMTPPQNLEGKQQIAGFTLILDSIMATGTFTLLMVVMVKLMGPPALVLFAPPVVIIGQLAYRVVVVDDHAGLQAQDDECKLASLELTRVTFTGFLAVSVTAISNASPNRLTNSFLLFAAVAIVLGLSLRLLSQTQIKTLLDSRPASSAHVAPSTHVASSANLASFCAHFCIVIATILFVVMAGTASGK